MYQLKIFVTETPYPFTISKSIICGEFTLQIFGEDIKDASVHGDRLVVYHQKGSIFRIYSLYRVIANSTVSGAKLGQHFDLDDYRSGIVGDPDFGIPVAKITGTILYT